MELIKKNIHMDRIKSEAVRQFTIEDDMNIPENKPDINNLSMQKGMIVIDEVKAGNDSVNVRGALRFAILYHTLENGSRLVCLEGRIPFDEKINMQGITVMDSVEVSGEIEDLTVEIINSRKLSLRVLVTLNAQAEELYDEAAPIGLSGAEDVEYRRFPVKLAQIAICKNDIFRIKDEIQLPQSYPNVYQILWSDVTLGDVEFKLLDETISVQGDVTLFLLYEGEGEERPIRYYETTFPFNGSIECHGCKEGMLPDIRYKLSQQDVSVKPDLDGEERCVGVELVMDVKIHVYDEEEIELITDVYGVASEVMTDSRAAQLRQLLLHVTGKNKVTDHIKTTNSSGILQLLHSGGKVNLDRKEVVEDGLLLQGSLTVDVLYITGDDENPYANVRAEIPFSLTLEVPGITPDDIYQVSGEVEQLQVTMLDGEEMDVKAVLSFSTAVFHQIPVAMISDVKIGQLNPEIQGALPGMAVYFVKKGDNLWSIGKKYYVPVEKIREVNGLEADDLNVGQKLLIVR